MLFLNLIVIMKNELITRLIIKDLFSFISHCFQGDSANCLNTINSEWVIVLVGDFLFFLCVSP